MRPTALAGVHCRWHWQPEGLTLGVAAITAARSRLGLWPNLEVGPDASVPVPKTMLTGSSALTRWVDDTVKQEMTAHSVDC